MPTSSALGLALCALAAVKVEPVTATTATTIASTRENRKVPPEAAGSFDRSVQQLG
jgi:hypothetical protein